MYQHELSAAQLWQQTAHVALSCCGLAESPAAAAGCAAHLMAASLFIVLKSGPTGFWALGTCSDQFRVTAAEGQAAAQQRLMRHLLAS